MKKERKFFETEVEKVAGSNDQLWFSASTEHRDRHGDVVVADGWKTKDFMKNPVFLWAHDYSKPPIGKAVQVEKGEGKLRTKMQFVPAHIDPFAEQIRQLYQEGYMRTVSVGFMTYKREPLTEDDIKQRPELKYGDRLYGDLMEVSAVPVPANPMALQNGFMEAMQKGMQREGIRPAAGQDLGSMMELLGCEEEGRLRKVRALFALTLGARGGLALSLEKKKEQLQLLRKEAEVMGDQSLMVLDIAAIAQDESLLRESFSDVWDEELLDLQARAQEQGVQEPEPEKKGLNEAESAALKAVLASTADTLAAVKAALS